MMDFSNLLIVVGLTIVLSLVVRTILKPSNKNVKLIIGFGAEPGLIINKAAVGFVSLFLIGLTLQVIGVLLP